MLKNTQVKSISNQMKEMLKGALSSLKILEPISELECFLAKNWASQAHKRLMFLQWGVGLNPEHFDHHIDLYYQWQKTSNPLWLERGIFSSLCLRGGAFLS